MKREVVSRDHMMWVAAQSGADPRTVRRYFSGEPMRPRIRERIAVADQQIQAMTGAAARGDREAGA
jgi:hypothetical protein